MPGVLKNEVAAAPRPPSGDIVGGTDMEPPAQNPENTTTHQSARQILEAAEDVAKQGVSSGDARKAIHPMLVLPPSDRGALPVDLSRVSDSWAAGALPTLEKIRAWSSLKTGLVTVAVNAAFVVGEGQYIWKTKTVELSTWIPSTLVGSAALVHELAHHLEINGGGCRI